MGAVSSCFRNDDPAAANPRPHGRTDPTASASPEASAFSLASVPHASTASGGSPASEHHGPQPGSSEARSNEHPVPPTSEQNADATKLQSAVRGYQTRQHVHVDNVATGIDHVQIKGNSEHFSRLGFENINTRNRDKTLQYLRVDGDKYEGHVAGGPLKTDVPDGNSRPAAQRAAEATGSRPSAYINGGYYNFLFKASEQHPTHTPIGKTTTSQGETSGLPIAVPSRMWWK